MLYMHTLTQSISYWLGSQLRQRSAAYAGWSNTAPPPTHTEPLCVGGGEGGDYDILQRNMANRGFMRIKQLKTTWTF